MQFQMPLMKEFWKICQSKSINKTIQQIIRNGQSPSMARKVQVSQMNENYTIWEGGEFPGFLNFPKSYPSEPPQYYWQLHGGQFQHMNVFENGATCIDILNNKIGYTPATTCVEILKGMEGFLYNPNPKSPTMKGLAKIFEENKEQYGKLVKAFVKHYMIEKEKKKQ